MIPSIIILISTTILLTVLSLIFKVAGKLRLTIPFIYFLVATISTLFTDWTTKNEQLVLIGLYILIGLVTLSWIFSLIKAIKNKFRSNSEDEALTDFVQWQLKRARENNISIDDITFDENGNMHDKTTGQQIKF